MHVTRRDDVGRASSRIDGRAHGVRLVVDADAGRDALARLDRDRERCLVDRFVLGRHQLEAELVAAPGGQREADPAARLACHEVDRVRSDVLGSHDEVALVLAILVVDDDDHLPGGDVLERLVDGCEPDLLACRRAHRVRTDQLLDVLGHDVHLQVHCTAGLGGSQGRALERLGDERDVERAFVDASDRQRDAVDGD